MRLHYLRHAIMLLLIFVGTSGVAQQEVRPGIATEAPFTKLIGTWQGEGWVSQGPDQRVAFHQTETIEAKAGGHVVVLEGIGRDPTSDEVVFEAFSYFTYDQAKQVITFTAFNQGNVITVEPELSDDTIIWGFDTPQGTIRYTITLSDTTWVEKGEFSPDGGETWMTIFEMNLTKVE